MGWMMRGGAAAALLRWARGLRFPYLLLITIALFAVNILVPDALPLVDELLLGMVALTLGSLKKKSPPPVSDPADKTGS